MSAGTLVDFLENALGCGIEEVEESLQMRPELIVQKRSEILGLLEDTWSGQSLPDKRRSEQDGELWPVLPRNAPDVVTLARTVRRSERRFGTSRRAADASRREIQGLLLYAHGVHLPNPLRLHDLSIDDDREFLRAVRQVCTLAPLISSGVVRVFEPEPPTTFAPDQHESETLDGLAAQIGLALKSYEGTSPQSMHQDLLRQAADVLLERALEHLVDLGSRAEDDGSGSLLLQTPYEAAAIKALLSTFGEEAGWVRSERDPDILRLDQLVNLRLPGLVDLALRDMVSIRDDESFGVFRTDIASALRDADGDVRAGSLASAQRIVGEHMDAGVARLNARTRYGALADATIADAVGWGLGAAVAGSLAGLKAVVATLVGSATTNVATNWPSAGERALRAHYVELGTQSLQKTPGAEKIDFVGFDQRDLWGPGLGRARRAAIREHEVEVLLRRVESDTSQLIESDEADELIRAAEEMVEEGDYHGHRLVAWITVAIARTCAENLDRDSRLRLARAAGLATGLTDNSLTALASSTLDPLLVQLSQDQTVDVGDLEELNELRMDMAHVLNDPVARLQVRNRPVG